MSLFVPSCRRPLPATTSLPRLPVILRKPDATPMTPGERLPSWPPEVILAAGIGTGALDTAVVLLSTGPRYSSELTPAV
jgi:hypothetical protein